MTAIWPILLLGVSGLLMGGAWSLHRQGASRAAVGLVAVFGVLAGAGGVLWLFPD